jgi:hypothetical protein
MPISMPAADREQLFKRIQKDNRDDIVLVVGHAMSVPVLLKLFGYSEEITISNDEHDNLFIVVPNATGSPTVLRLRY